jgi:endoglucanase
MINCAPATCHLDHIESWSLNDVTINWNAPLAWVVAYLDEVAQRRRIE